MNSSQFGDKWQNDWKKESSSIEATEIFNNALKKEMKLDFFFLVTYVL